MSWCLCQICSCGKHHCENTERPKPPVQVSALLLPDNQGKVGLCSPSVHPSRNDGQPTDEPTVRSAYGNQRAHTPFGSGTDERPPLKAGMASHSVYTEDFQAWDSPVRVHPFRPRDNLKVNRELFATATTNRDSFCRPGPPVAARESCGPAPPPREVPPFDGTADYSSQYVSPAVRPRRPPARPAYHPPGPPLARVFRGQPSETARSFEPAAAWERSPASFASTTEFRDQFRTWPLPARPQPQTREYRAPEGDMALLSTTRAHFGEHRGFQRPPGARPPREAWVRDRPPAEASVRSSVRSTMKEDFRAWTTLRRLPVAPPPQELERPRGPFARTTTARASYTPKAAQRSLSCKPRPRPLNTGPPMEKDSVYRASFTAPRGPVRDGAATPPPGFRFHSVDPGGRRMYRTAPAERGVAGAGRGPDEEASPFGGGGGRGVGSWRSGR